MTVIASALTPTFPTLGGLNRSTCVRMGGAAVKLILWISAAAIHVADPGCRFAGEQTVRLLSLWTELRRISLALNLRREN